MTDTALILVDFQKEWIDKNSDYYVGDISKTLETTNRLIKSCRNNNFEIIFTKHIEPEEEEAFAKNSGNIEIIEDLDFQKDDAVITKNRISPFYKTNLEKELEGINRIVICGILTNLCVRSLIQDAYDRDFDITVITDCCIAMDQETQDFTIKDLKETREEIKFLCSDEFLKPINNL